MAIISLSFLRLSLQEPWSGVVKWERSLVISCVDKVPMLDDFHGGLSPPLAQNREAYSQFSNSCRLPKQENLHK